MKSLLLMFLFSAISQCFGQSDELDLKNNFSESEIVDLNKIADFFQSELCGSTDRTEFGKCLIEYYPSRRTWNYSNTALAVKLSIGNRKSFTRALAIQHLKRFGHYVKRLYLL